MAKSDHSWAFFRAGGVDQVALRDGSDVKALSTLDKKLWVALACPTKGTEIDEKTLSMIDSDQDGRIRPPEVLDVVLWSEKVFKSLEVLFEKGATLPLAQLNDSTKEGKAVLASAKRILRDQDKKDAKEISLDDVSAMEKVFVATKFNGDGVIPADSAESADVAAAITDVIEAVGSVPDRSGKPGVDKALVERFITEAEAYLAWAKEGEAEGLAPLGAETAAAAEALAVVEEKVRDYFTRAKVASFDGRAATSLNATEAELTALSPKLLAADDDDLKKLPLAKVEAGRALPLETGVNPAWSAEIATFVKLAVGPLVGAKPQLTEADFETVVTKLAPARAWTAKKPTTGVAKLTPARAAELVESRDAVLALIEEDAALADDYAEITAVEKAIRVRRDLLRLLRNFVNFADFYNKKDGSFQAGTLFLDARQCELVIYVNDAAKHAALAGMSKAYLAYCDCSRKDGAKTQIVAAFTAGDVDNLMVGRNGVFYDRSGQDWDATITSIVENPISVRQAFWSPYKRFIRTIEEYVAKRAADKEKESTGMVDKAATDATKAAEAPPPAPAAAPAPAPPVAPAPAPPADKPMDIGTVAAIGVAVGGIGTFLGMIFSKFLDLGLWMPLGILALLFVISGPSMLIAWLKLRQRNLGPLLDANGWAVNAMTKINVPFGGSLTKVASLPLGASRMADDPYAEKKTPWALYVFLLVLLGGGVLWAMGKLDGYLPEKARSATVFARSAPSAAPPASAAPAAAPPAPPPPPAPAK
jgi:hypothetical protein